MELKRNGSTILNTDKESYILAKKRSKNLKDRKEKDLTLKKMVLKVDFLEKKLEQLHNNYIILEDRIKKLEGIIHDFS